MSESQRYTGKNLKVYWNTTSNEISGDYTALTVQAQQDSVEKTAGSESTKTFIPTTETVTFQLTAYDTGTNGALVSLYNGLEGTLLFAPQGTADGKPAYQIPAFVAGDNDNYAFNEVVKREMSFQANAQWIAHYKKYDSVWSNGTIDANT